jgi:hypothetical protein
MTKERVIKESKEYLQYAHETLRKAFKNAPGAEGVFIDAALKDIEKSVNQLEALNEMMKVWKITKGKNLESITEE